MSELRIGAGGWAYFQVPGMDSLQAYSGVFDFVELNSSYYELPSYEAASDWRQRVPANFQFSVRCPRIIVDHYGLKLLPGASALLERLEEICRRLDATVLTVLIGKRSPIKEGDLALRIKEFLEGFNADNTVVALEFRGMRPSEEVFDAMKESEAVHAVDLSLNEPHYENTILYSRLFGKGPENVYEFDDAELRDIAKKATGPKFEKSILAFHGVRMYRDAARVKSFVDKGFFPKITSGVGVDSIKEILSEDAHFPATKSSLVRDQGWKVYQDEEEVRKISTVLERLPETSYSNLEDLIADLRNRPGLFSAK